ncbi:preprotein translocase subunit SecG [Sphingobium boeckii]|uniref:Protein-export membrane protein SecG n=1 Tax=Sphingobium boeckii TaxID=1082345 RepID=A0A7W9AK43_9SPHN|nr:preprotein translocase subunit SecG [Sphingobium boeckii]
MAAISMFTFLLVVHAIIAAALVAVILMQRSEGGGLGMGGSPSGLMSARGAADFLTRATTVLAALFVAMCIFLAVLAATRGGSTTLDDSLVAPAGAPAPGGGALAPAAIPVPATNDPLAGGNAAAPVTATPAQQAVAPAAKVEKAPATRSNPDPVTATKAPASSGNAAAAPKLAPPPVVSTTPAPTNGVTPPQ